MAAGTGKPAALRAARSGRRHETAGRPASECKTVAAACHHPAADRGSLDLPDRVPGTVAPGFQRAAAVVGIPDRGAHERGGGNASRPAVSRPDAKTLAI